MITILMAAYNGERFIAEQIDSIMLQTEQNFVLHIQDDYSADGTYPILCAYAAKYPGKIFIHRNPENSGAAKWNFLQMMTAFQDDYVMLCDQDDVWLPNKIEITMKQMRAMEEAYGRQTPILVHTDLVVVDDRLSSIGKSLNQMLGLRMERSTLSSQIVQNTVTGCSSMYNRALAQLVRVPQFCIVHDWWLGLIAVSFGKKAYLSETTMLYRQHGVNSIGAKKVASLTYIVGKAFHPKEVRAQLDATYRQAGEFLRVYNGFITPAQELVLSDYASIPNYGKVQRWMIVRKLGILKHGFIRRIAQFLYI